MLRKGLASKDVLASGRGAASSVATTAEEAAAAEPTLIDQGIKVEAPKVRGITTAGTEKLLRIPLKVKDRDKLPEKLKASVRWDPIEVSVVPADPEEEVQAEEAAEPDASAEPEAPLSRRPHLRHLPASRARGVRRAGGHTRRRARGIRRAVGRTRGRPGEPGR